MRVTIPQAMIDLPKGSDIPRSEVLALMPDAGDEDSIRLQVLAFAAMLERQRRLAGRPCTVRSLRLGLVVRILTDSEASVYNARAFKRKLRGARRRHVSLMDVDIRGFNPDDRKAHESALNVQGRIMVAIELARRPPVVQPAVRGLPRIKHVAVQEVAHA